VKLFPSLALGREGLAIELADHIFRVATPENPAGGGRVTASPDRYVRRGRIHRDFEQFGTLPEVGKPGRLGPGFQVGTCGNREAAEPAGHEVDQHPVFAGFIPDQLRVITT